MLPLFTEELLSLQNNDGGWPYRRGGSSWTEPTAYAALALSGHSEAGPAARAVSWLLRAQRSDGGWSPQPGVSISTWVTAAALLLGKERLGVEAHGRGLSWLLRQTGAESTLWNRMRRRMQGLGPEYEDEVPGWPWMPGNAAWVTPTAIAILALRQEESAEARQRAALGRRYLLARACRSGGWNHGSSRALGREADPYPETTGIALLALRGAASPKLAAAIGRAEAFGPSCRSAEGLAWLRLGLLAHGRPVGERAVPPRRTPMDAALSTLAASAALKDPFA